MASPRWGAPTPRRRVACAAARGPAEWTPLTVAPRLHESAPVRWAMTVTVCLLAACGSDDDACPEVAIEGCALDTAQGDLVCTLEHEGTTRGYRVVVPEAAACAPAPLVFDLHGLTSNPVQQEWISGIARLGREEGFIA